MYMTPEGNIRLPFPPNGARSFKMGVKQHFTGSLVAGDDEGREIELESNTEMLTALVMLARRDVVNLESQVRFDWTDEGDKATIHTFDFRAYLRNGTRVALIVKNSKDAAELEFRARMRRLASQATPDFADRVCLITDRDLDPVDVHNAELIHSVRLPDPDPEPDAAVRRVVAGITGAARISDIVAASGCGGSGFRAVVRLIRIHELELVTHERIEPGSLVRRIL